MPDSAMNLIIQLTIAYVIECGITLLHELFYFTKEIKMRYSILGFNQEKLLQYDLSMNEILLLSYIYEAQASPKMKHTMDDNYTYVWLSHTKVHEDLPILNVNERQLKRYLKHLTECGLIVSTIIANDSTRGSKAYYGITEECEELRYNPDQVSKMSLENERPSVKNVTSYSKLISNNQLDKSISKDIDTDFEFGYSKKSKTKKPSLYDKCVSMINDFTNDKKERDLLVKALNLFLENNREAGTRMYSNQFKGKLNTLQKLSSHIDIKCEIIQQTLDNGWNNFYELKTDKRKSNNTHDRLNESGDLYVEHSDKRKEIEKFGNEKY